METKICRICGIEKPISDFNKAKKWYQNRCKQCQSEYVKNYREKNKVKLSLKAKKYYQNNKEKIKENTRNAYKKDKDKILARNKKYTEENIENIKKQRKEYRVKNREHLKEKAKKYYENNSNKIKERTKKYNIEHKKEKGKYIKKYNSNRRQNDNIFKIKSQLRCMINASFRKKGLNKSKSTAKILGISLKEMYEYLLQTFENNYGYKWDGIEKVHIDHVIPLTTANTKEEVMQLCNYKNLQLLKAKDNLQKGSKLNYKIKGE